MKVVDSTHALRIVVSALAYRCSCTDPGLRSTCSASGASGGPRAKRQRVHTSGSKFCGTTEELGLNGSACPTTFPLTPCRVACVRGTRNACPTKRGYRQSRVFSLGSGALSLSLNLTRHRSRFHSLYDKSRRKTRDGHSHTRVPRIGLTRNGHTDSQVLGTMCDLRVRM